MTCKSCYKYKILKSLASMPANHHNTNEFLGLQWFITELALYHATRLLYNTFLFHEISMDSIGAADGRSDRSLRRYNPVAVFNI